MGFKKTRSEKIDFTGHNGLNLSARLELPTDSIPRSFAVFAHCFTCNKNSLAASRISEALADKGMATLRFDFTGLGNSDGDFANTNFTSNIDDLICAVNFMRENYQAPRLLVGHSLGGAAVLALAGDVEEVRAVATIGAPFDPVHVLGALGEEGRKKIEKEGVADLDIAGRPFKIKKQFIEDIESYRQADRIQKLKKPLLVLHAPKDNVVGIENAQEIFQHALHPKSFVSLDQADHLLVKRADGYYAAGVIAAWAQRYIGEEEVAEDMPAEGVVEVCESMKSRLHQTIRVGPHSLTADEPVAVGGTNAGPAPFDFILAGLGACSSMTMRLYADRKEIAPGRIRVALQHEREGDKHIIRRTISFDGEIDEDARQKLIDIAARCPVHRMLESTVEVETQYQESLHQESLPGK